MATTQPLVGIGHGPASGLSLERARPGLPSVEQGLRGRAGRVECQHLVTEVLQDDWRVGHPGRLAHDRLRLGTLDGQLGEGAVHLVGHPQLGELGADDQGMDRLGHLDERRLPAELDDRQLPAFGGGQQGRGQGVGEASAQLDDEAGDAGVVELLDERGELGGPSEGKPRPVDSSSSPPRSRWAMSGELGDVRPSHRSAQSGGPCHHPRSSPPEGVQLEDVRDGRVHRRTVPRALTPCKGRRLKAV